jgi:hypothetical protein
MSQCSFDLLFSLRKTNLVILPQYGHTLPHIPHMAKTNRPQPWITISDDSSYFN